MNKLSFQQKLWVPLICSLLCITAIFIYQTMQMRDVRIEERQIDLMNLDDAGMSILKLYGEKATSGALSKEDAQKQAMAVIAGLRFGKDGYITITQGTRSLMNPFKAENNGKDMADFKDPNGV